MTKRRLAQFLVLLVILVTVLAAATAAAQGPHSFMWRVGAGSGTVFLLGSIHMAKPDIYPLPPRIEEAFSVSGTLVVEADITRTDQAVLQKWIMAHGLYAQGDSLENHLSARTREKAVEMKMDLSMFQNMKPWLAAVSLQAIQAKALGYDEAYGVDRHFLEQAAGANKKVLELEGLMFQLKLFQGISDRHQDLFLYATLVELENMEKTMDKMLSAWQAGDAGELERLFFKGYREHPNSSR